MNQLRKYYNKLGLIYVDVGNPTKKQIQTAFLGLAKKYHPDKGGNEEEFKAVNEANMYIRDYLEKNQAEPSVFTARNEQAAAAPPYVPPAAASTKAPFYASTPAAQSYASQKPGAFAEAFQRSPFFEIPPPRTSTLVPLSEQYPYDEYSNLRNAGHSPGSIYASTGIRRGSIEDYTIISLINSYEEIYQPSTEKRGHGKGGSRPKKSRSRVTKRKVSKSRRKTNKSK